MTVESATADAPIGQRLFTFDNTYATALDGFGAPWEPVPVPTPLLVKVNADLARSLGIDPAELVGEEATAVFAGAAVPAGAAPVAQVYAGHQFGNFSPQLGDGRAVLLGEVVDPTGRRFDVALKGSGRTPFSRGGDGKASLGPVLREYLMGEAMHALGIPTTRALAAATTGDMVRREGLFPGAVLTRVASSHLRVGTFQFFSARGDIERLGRLIDYAIDRHEPAAASADNPPLALLDGVIDRQADLIARWMNIGFIHGVMNTDNVTISGETIDYGPCAFIDAFDPATVFSSIDHAGRYAYGNQPSIGLWNLARLAEALLPLIDDDQDRAVELATASLDRYQGRYDSAWLDGMRAKLGLDGARAAGDDDDTDRALATDWMESLQRDEVDFTTAFRRLTDAADGTPGRLRELFATPIDAWLERWQSRLGAGAASAMRTVNPFYIPRNHLVEEALTAAVRGDLEPFDQLLAVVTEPFDERPGHDRYASAGPDGFSAGYQTFCGT